MPGGALLHRRRGEDFKIHREKLATEYFQSSLRSLGRIFLCRPGNGTGPIGEGERIGEFAEHISGSHEIRFYGRQANGNELVAGERKREEKKEREEEEGREGKRS